MDTPVVVNNVAEHRFEVSSPEGLARLDYRYDSTGRLVLIHTEVPPQLAGRGLAGQIAHTALEFAKSNNLAIVPQCPYVQAYLERNPQYKALVH
jgi:predicted GNAT family acetyltransferase